MNREALTMALAQLRWLAFGQCRTEGWEGPPPSAADTEKVLVAALASAPAATEPLVYQYRLRPEWDAKWRDWENCSEGMYKDCRAAPLVNGWLYEARALTLYAAPIQDTARADSLPAILGDLRHSARVDGYTDDQVAFLQSLAVRLETQSNARSGPLPTPPTEFMYPTWHGDYRTAEGWKSYAASPITEKGEGNGHPQAAP